MSSKLVTYISIDVETDGPIPGFHSMRELGAAAFVDGETAPSQLFSMILSPLPRTEPDPDTMSRFWSKHPKEWARLNGEEKQSPRYVMWAFAEWVRSFPNPLPLCAPAGFDYAFIRYYLQAFPQPGKQIPLGHRCEDVRSYLHGAGVLKDFGGSWKRAVRRFVGSGAPKEPHTHVAVEDAVEQGTLFMLAKQKLDKLRKGNV